MFKGVKGNIVWEIFGKWEDVTEFYPHLANDPDVQPGEIP